MIGAGSLEFAHARIWARWGARADETLWHRIEVARELPLVLDIARAGPLARWVEGIGPASGAHAIEAALRRHWHACVAELAGWMPVAWQPAVQWCAPLPDLPLLQHLARGEPAPAWVAGDDVLRALAEGLQPAAPARAAPAALPAQAPALAALLAAARAEPQHLLGWWSAQWRARWPRDAGGGAIERELLPLLVQHARAFGAPEAVDGWALRRSLQARLVALLRRALVEPVAAFAFLALQALEFERLRAELVARAVFPGRVPAP